MEDASPLLSGLKDAADAVRISVNGASKTRGPDYAPMITFRFADGSYRSAEVPVLGSSNEMHKMEAFCRILAYTAWNDVKAYTLTAMVDISPFATEADKIPEELKDVKEAVVAVGVERNEDGSITKELVIAPINNDALLKSDMHGRLSEMMIPSEKREAYLNFLKNTHGDDIDRAINEVCNWIPERKSLN